MKEYNKIETLYERAKDGSKKLIEGAWRNSAVCELRNIEWIWTEKVDGTNIRVHWDGHEITFGGRTDKAQIPAHLVNYLNNTFKNNETEQLFEQEFGEKEVTLYGEGYGIKIQKGGSYRDDVSFILFDVMVGDAFLNWNSVVEVSSTFGIDIVPVVNTGTLYEAVEFVKGNPYSDVALKQGCPMEGLVCRPYIELQNNVGKRIMVKVKCKDFE